MSAADLCSRLSIVDNDLSRVSIDDPAFELVKVRVILISFFFPLLHLINLEVDFSDSTLPRNINFGEISGLAQDFSKETNALI